MSVALIAGGLAWGLPRRLDKVMPNVDIEGEGLLEALERSRASSPAPAMTVQQPSAETALR